MYVCVCVCVSASKMCTLLVKRQLELKLQWTTLVCEEGGAGSWDQANNHIQVTPIAGSKDQIWKLCCKTQKQKYYNNRNKQQNFRELRWKKVN